MEEGDFGFGTTVEFCSSTAAPALTPNNDDFEEDEGDAIDQFLVLLEQMIRLLVSVFQNNFG